MDLVDRAVLVGGLDFWKFVGEGEQLNLPRLRDTIAERFPDLTLANDAPFRVPPAGEDRHFDQRVGVQALEFPTWMVCHRCRALVLARNLEEKRGHYRHRCTGSKSGSCVPVRFVAACQRGHLSDVLWVPFAHSGSGRCSSPALTLHEGNTGDFSEIVVGCVCGARKRLSTAMAPEGLWTCRGERPWLGDEGREESCDEKLRLLVRTASHSYFAQIQSALDVPDPGDPLIDGIRVVWDFMKEVTAETLPALRAFSKVKNALGDTTDEEVLEAVQQVRDGQLPPRQEIRTQEFQQFVAAQPEQLGELPPADKTFFARSVTPPADLPAQVARLVVAPKLREVRVQVGFTRLEPATPNLQGQYEEDVTPALLGLKTDWLPASEVMGEGIFVELSEAALTEWEARPPVKERAAALQRGHQRWAEDLERPPEFYGPRFYLVHSLAHLLISAIALSCGYAASAIRERIYCSTPGEEPSMAAFLLSTGTSGSEGTLGGLVHEGRNIIQHLRRAWDLGRLCSNDPVCAAHSPEGDPAGRYLEGAACHGCLFIAECSCERYNRYLDRALVLPTIGHPPELAFFPERP